MTDREKLGNLLRSGCKELEKIPGCKTWEDMADYLIANGVTVQRWIPVTERLPEDEFEVLAKTEYGGQVVAIYDSEHKEWQNWSDEYREYYGFCGYMGKVTHWMPLPEPPEEEICNSVTG